MSKTLVNGATSLRRKVLPDVRRLARQIADKFHPDRIILFGSYAYGTPHKDSDVDLLVVMPAKNETRQAVRICLALDRDFPMDLIVRTPQNLRWRLKEGDWFLREVPVQPVWVCPLKLRASGPAGTPAPGEAPWPLYPLVAGETYVNVGFWSTVPIQPSTTDS